MKRQVDNNTYLKYLLQSLTVDELKQVCRDFQIKGFSKFKRADLFNFILDTLAEEEIEETIEQKELGIISKEITSAIKKINGEDRETITEIKIINPKNHEIEIIFSGFNWKVGSFLSITPNNIKDPERDCDCRVGSNMGFCSHFWVGLILSLKEGYFSLKDWTLTELPENFEEIISPIRISTPHSGAESATASNKRQLIDESSDSAGLVKYINSSISIYEGEILNIVEKQSEFQGNISVYYQITLKNVRLGPRIARKSDYREDDIITVKELNVRISEKLQNDNQLKKKDKIKVNGKLDKDSFSGIMVKNIRKVQKL
ncbi:hypothetical protein LCGC14_1310260 [marine sediment metagenome]|uniref:Uncharacterized protein n=1 Tax=marine sediment metagenome TaxID=412755 RepID=A0A0F9KMQ4_9ZZZZ|nr:MAG: hypothetical protein Lokiarch_00130 [Candidatus Lokiarchaeum sp. GC14_75]